MLVAQVPKGPAGADPRFRFGICRPSHISNLLVNAVSLNYLDLICLNRFVSHSKLLMGPYRIHKIIKYLRENQLG
jgi:hypothetical protein